jgi:hypothetical protein
MKKRFLPRQLLLSVHKVIATRKHNVLVETYLGLQYLVLHIRLDLFLLSSYCSLPFASDFSVAPQALENLSFNALKPGS